MRPRIGTLVEAALSEYPRDALIFRGSGGQIIRHKRSYRILPLKRRLSSAENEITWS
jgi:hypothetical protein